MTRALFIPIVLAVVAAPAAYAAPPLRAGEAQRIADRAHPLVRQLCPHGVVVSYTVLAVGKSGHAFPPCRVEIDREWALAMAESNMWVELCSLFTHEWGHLEQPFAPHSPDPASNMFANPAPHPVCLRQQHLRAKIQTLRRRRAARRHQSRRIDRRLRELRLGLI